MNTEPQTLAIVVPCYNEREVFPISLEKLSSILKHLIVSKKISESSYILFVDDGSQDNTWSLIVEAGTFNLNIRGLKLAHNKGHQIALIAGITNADADMVVTIDADLQDDPFVIEQMVDKYLIGYDIVYGVRNSRETDNFWKRTMAESFYKLMAKLGVEQIHNHADFRLLSRRARESLLQYQEENVYLRGLVPMLGFRTIEVYYERHERAAGVTKYPFKKSLALAIEGITSLSVKPLRLITILGLFVFLLSVVAIIYTIIEKILGNTIQGWSSIIVIISFFGGIQIMALGVIGEYIGKIYNEVKKRPKFFIDETSNIKEK
ncbi:glycosyltransferase [Entomomonas moraniae]|uniref:Glycosyltransferase n=1 Tax=Entomomonas moraniae TaxID=2213226 RepID=A0A451EQJ1_9GAMM|nr:glycosyltransferase family 2 protein [Entomomonas moraniae]AZS52111.1 glycosyltransferase [Entomomonas moraniae]